MWIKICGNTSLEDAQLAADLGADALGFIFAPSKRRVTPQQVSSITPNLPPGSELVGVFQGQTAAEIVEIVNIAGLTAVQLHDATTDKTGGNGDPDAWSVTRRVHDALGDRIRIIQALHWTVAPELLPNSIQRESTVISPRMEAHTITRQLASLAASPGVDRVLIDSRVGAATGGTGVCFDWMAAREALSCLPSRLHLILAGGLDPRNVAEGIRILQPWGVDAVSGVEASPGHKDAQKLATFIQNARA